MVICVVCARSDSSVPLMFHLVLPQEPTYGSGVSLPMSPFASIPSILYVRFGNFVIVSLSSDQNLVLSGCEECSPGA